LVQKTVRDEAKARRDHAGPLAALAALSSAFPQDTSAPAWWPHCEQLLPHVLALSAIALPQGDAARDVIALLNRAAEYLVYAGGGERAIAAAEAITDRAERLLGADHPYTLTAWGSLAESYQSAVRVPDAIGMQERVLADRERILGPDHLNTLMTRGD